MRLSRLDRYEARAFARRKRAILDLDPASPLSEQFTKRSQRRNPHDFKQADIRQRTSRQIKPIRALCGERRISAEQSRSQCATTRP
jgi:hypothetical protein